MRSTTALSEWPEPGVPENPEGWLLTVARNRQRDVVEVVGDPHERPAGTTAPSEVGGRDPARRARPRRDRRSTARAAVRVRASGDRPRSAHARSCCRRCSASTRRRSPRPSPCPPAAMAQRLVRAKRRIREPASRSSVPDRTGDARAPARGARGGLRMLRRAWRRRGRRPRARVDGRRGAVPGGHARRGCSKDEPEAWSLAALVDAVAARDRRARGPVRSAGGAGPRARGTPR